MAQLDLTQAYPDADPVGGPPPLSRINGVGLGMYGKRDPDPSQGLYIKTLCFSVIFVPVFALRSYVVADADRGWYFLARVPMSGFAKLWNLLVVVGVLSLAAGIGWLGYTGSPNYVAQQRLEDGEEAEARGAYTEAAIFFQQVADGPSDHAGAGEQRLGELIGGAAEHAPAGELAGVMDTAVNYSQRRGAVPGNHDLLELAVKASYRLKDATAQARLDLLDAVEPLVTETNRERWLNARLAPLKKLVEQDPTHATAVSELAVVYEGRGELDEAKALLLPAINTLGNSEGARVLGQLLAAEGEFEGACRLLEPYAASRVTELQQAELAWDAAYEYAYDQAIKELERGDAGDAWYARYDSSTPEQQDEMVGEYVRPRLDADPQVIAARERYLAVSGVVDVAMDLAVAQLGLAQSQADPDQRRAGLEQAEQTFLSIQGSAGEDAEYRLYLGQVYYWLGRADEGQQLFDDLLAEAPGDGITMSAVGQLLRQVGETERAIALYEQAYKAEADAQMRYEFASMLAVMGRDRDERVKWLERCSPQNKQARADLKSMLGDEAAEAGEVDQAIAYYDQALAIYDQLSETSSMLNNSALLLISRFGVSGDTADRDRALDRMVRSVEMEPSNTVVLRNTADLLMSAAVYDLVAPRLDLPLLGLTGELGLIDYLAHNQEEHRRLVAELKARPRFTKAISMYQRVVLLAPKSTDAYLILAGIYDYLEDEQALSTLLERAVASSPDTRAGERQLRVYLAGNFLDQQRTSSATREAALREVLARPGVDAPTRSVAGVLLADLLLGRDEMTLPVDADEVVALAEAAWQAAPSSAAESTLRAALCYRATRRLSAEHATLRRLWDQLGKTHSDLSVLNLAVGADAAARAAAGADPDLQRVLELRADGRARFPGSANVTLWALSRYIAPDHASPEARRVADSDAERLVRDLSVLLLPYRADTVWSAAWANELAGRSARGRRLVEQYNALGLE